MIDSTPQPALSGSDVDNKPLKDKYKEALKSIIEFLPLLSVIGFFYGCVRIFVYYSRFEINILNYIDVSEILKITIKDTILVMVVSLILIGVTSTIIASFNWVLRIVTFLLIAIIAWIIIHKIFFNPDEPISFADVSGMITPLVTWPVLYLSLFLAKRNDVYVMIIGTLFFIFSMSYNVGLAYANILVKFKSTVGNSLYMKDKSIIKSTPSYLYIGKTDNYVFFYNTDKNSTDVIKMDDVAKITIKFEF